MDQIQTRDYAPGMLSVLRIVTALVLFSYGTQKVLGIPAVPDSPPVGSLFWIAGVLELVLGFMVLIGFMTRISSFLLSGMMAIAYFMVHFPQSFFPAQNGGTAAILFCFIFLYLAAAGPGPWSVDAKRHSDPYRA